MSHLNHNLRCSLDTHNPSGLTVGPRVSRWTRAGVAVYTIRTRSPILTRVRCTIVNIGLAIGPRVSR